MLVKSWKRYARQIEFLGKKRQNLIEKSNVVVVGCGALSNTVTSLLVRMNVKRIRLIDRDRVEESNLPRCMLFDERDIGKPKAKVLQRKLKKINSECGIESVIKQLDEKNLDLLEDFDIVIDCSDNMETKHLINIFCLKRKKPWVFGALSHDEGFFAAFSGKKPCLSCIFPQKRKKPKRVKAVFSPLPNILGSLQVVEAVRIMTKTNPSYGILYHVSLREMKISPLRISQRECEICKPY